MPENKKPAGANDGSNETLFSIPTDTKHIIADRNTAVNIFESRVKEEFDAAKELRDVARINRNSMPPGPGRKRASRIVDECNKAMEEAWEKLADVRRRSRQ